MYRSGGLFASGTRSFPSPTSHSFIYKCPPHLSMSGTNILPGAHDFAVNGTINAARIVRKAVRYSSSKLMACISYRLTSTTALATKRYPTQSFPLCQTQAHASQAGWRLLQNSRNIFPLISTMGFRRESTFYCMEWGVLEKLKFA